MKRGLQLKLISTKSQLSRAATGFFTATFYPNPEVRILAATVRPASSRDQAGGEVTTEAEAQAEAQADLTEVEKAIFSSCASSPKAGEELIASAGYSVRTGNFKTALTKLLIRGLIEMTIPDKPRSPKQRYRITPRGREILGKTQGKP